MQNRSPVKKITGGCFTKIIIGFLGLVISVVFALLLDHLLNPWAHSLTGKPTLTGMWIGQVTSPSGQTRELFLDLQRSDTGDGSFYCSTCPRIDGTAKMCGDGGEVKVYEVWGSPDTWSGARFHINYPRSVGEPIPGLQAGKINGEWSGDVLKIGMTFGLHVEKGGVIRSDDPDLDVPAQFSMVRGTESDFLAKCRSISPHGLQKGK